MEKNSVLNVFAEIQEVSLIVKFDVHLQEHLNFDETWKIKKEANNRVISGEQRQNLFIRKRNG